MAGTFPEPGPLFEARFRIRSMIGSGGFARVYSAMQEDLGQVVGLKILTPSEDGDYLPNVVVGFNQEARLVSRLQDPNPSTIFDFGRSPDGLVFEYVNRAQARFDALKSSIESDQSLGQVRCLTSHTDGTFIAGVKAVQYLKRYGAGLI
jgi:serine/threonine protein kinase